MHADMLVHTYAHTHKLQSVFHIIFFHKEEQTAASQQWFPSPRTRTCAYICYKHIWIASPTSKTFSTINHTAYASVAPSFPPNSLHTPPLFPAKTLRSGNTPQIPARPGKRTTPEKPFNEGFGRGPSSALADVMSAVWKVEVFHWRRQISPHNAESFIGIIFAEEIVTCQVCTKTN